jgi:hypothetical protein
MINKNEVSLRAAEKGEEVEMNVSGTKGKGWEAGGQ